MKMRIFAILVAVVLTAGNIYFIGFGLEVAVYQSQYVWLIVALLTLIASCEMGIKPLFRLVGEQEVRKHLAKRGKGE